MAGRYCTGGHYSDTNFDCNGLIKKTDSYGNEQWSKIFGGTKEDVFVSVQQTTDGGYTITGYAESYAGSRDGWIIKTNNYGNMQWSKTVGGANKDEIRSVLQNNDGSYVFAGYTGSYGAGSNDGWLIKISDKSSSIVVNSPNGGENWPRGTTKQIK